jgi:2Fe-2S ferredoxin
MQTLIFVQPDGQRQQVQVQNGKTVMEAARDNAIQGIQAECGGECACCTCHCYVDPEWASSLNPKSAAEAGLVEFAWEPNENSRLTCQIIVTDKLNGLIFHVPAQQL